MLRQVAPGKTAAVCLAQSRVGVALLFGGVLTMAFKLHVRARGTSCPVMRTNYTHQNVSLSAGPPLHFIGTVSTLTLVRAAV